MSAEPRYYAGIIKLHETEDVESANKLLATGWELIGLKERSISVVTEDGKFTTQVAPTYVLGFSRPADMGAKEPAPQPQQQPSAPPPQAPGVEQRLERLQWTPAQSGKCDFIRGAPADLVQAVRASKDGVKGQLHHFTASSSEPTLFRFKRGGKQ